MKGKIALIPDAENPGQYILPISVTKAIKSGKDNLADIIGGIGCSVLYVATDGDDSNDGSFDYPLLTIAEAIKMADVQTSSNVAIVVREGAYSLDETITINSHKNITIIADGEVEVNSLHGVPFSMVDGLAVTDGGHEAEWLFVNGERRVLASTPRPNTFNVKGGGTTLAQIPWKTNQAYALDAEGNRTNYSGGQARDAKLYNKRLFVELGVNHEDAVMLATDNLYQRVRIHVYCQWTSKFCSIYAVDTENDLITLTNYNNNFDSPSIENAQRLMVENIIQPITTWNNKETFVNGSFYFDGSGVIRYKPLIGEVVQKIELATLDNFFNIYTPCKFVGIKFRGSKYDWLDENGVCPDRQGAYRIENLIRVYGDNVDFYGCEFTDIEGNCVGYYNGSKNGSVRNCYFHNIGASSVKIGEYHGSYAQELGVTPEWNTSTYPVSGTYVLTENITMENCVVAHYGEIFEQSCGIILFFSKNCHIRHNDVMFGYYTGITFGYCWDSEGTAPDGARHTTDAHYLRGGDISYNRVVYINGGLLKDFGCIYGLGRTHGLMVRGNKLGYAYSTNNLSSGIYSDQSVVDATYRDNEIFKCTYGIFCNWHNINNKFIHNAIFATKPLSTHRYNSGLTFEGNIFCSVETTLTEKPSSSVIDGNLWYATSGSINADSYDTNPSYGNPYFADAANGNLHITDTTNTDKIGWYENTYTAGVLNPQQKEIVRTYADEESRYKILYV